ncbi:MAG: QueT transporter family protein [Clostridia bacterium]|nr:QueT transporter family protein [Clostridia bacterium]
MSRRTLSTRDIAMAGIIAALYVVLTYIANAMGLASGAIQVRLSEALTILPCFTGAAIPGLTIGCVVANQVTGCAAMDVALGSVATLIGAVGTRLLKDKPFLAWIPPVLSNAVIVPFVLQYAYGLEDAWWYLALTVGAGEVIACGILGLLLYHSLKRVPHLF